MRLPESIAAVVGGLPYAREDIGMSGAGVLVYEDFVLKIRPEGGHDTSDTQVLRFLEGLLPVPKVIAQENLNGMDFLLMERLKGRMLTDSSILEKPSLLIGCMAEALERLWAVPPEKVPFPRTLDVDLAYVAQRVANGSVNPSECEPETFGPGGFASPEALLNYLQNNRPEEDLVLTHGDFCLPNLLTDGKRLTGMIDVGDCGIADRYKDLAIGWRSLKHNTDGHYGLFYPAVDPDDLFRAVGIPKDEEKLRYYLLLDELF